MATGEQLKALIESHTEGDDDRFWSVALQVAVHAARTGKSKLATELQALVDAAQRQRSRPTLAPTVPLARPRGDLEGLVTAVYPSIRLSHMVVAESTYSKLERVLREYRQADQLRVHGFEPRRKLLLIGPPGCGKTMTAAMLAGELGLPLLTVQLHSLITKFMGETAAKLHLVFDAMAETRGVYLFDEFDAIGSHRGGQSDVSEMRRVLNSFLQFLEQDSSTSLVVAATNLRELLDEALFRRFDDVISYELPDAPMAWQLVRDRLAVFNLDLLDRERVARAAEGLSHAEIVRACEDAGKEAILNGGAVITGDALVQALGQRKRQDQSQM